MHRHGIRAHLPRRYRVCTTDSQAFPAGRGQPAGSEFRGREARSEPAPAQAGVWLADITYIATGEGWLCLAVILDLFTRKVVGWAMREHMRAELTMAALTMAIQRRRPGAGLIHHSDRGSQYAAGDYRKILQAAAITQSMSRKANCRDNAPMESFFGTLKTELVHQREYPDREAARRDLFAYIEGYYNRRRIHSAIGYITPEQPDRKAA
jgi:putative transposase